MERELQALETVLKFEEERTSFLAVHQKTEENIRRGLPGPGIERPSFTVKEGLFRHEKKTPIIESSHSPCGPSP